MPIIDANATNNQFDFFDAGTVVPSTDRPSTAVFAHHQVSGALTGREASVTCAGRGAEAGASPQERSNDYFGRQPSRWASHCANPPPPPCPQPLYAYLPNFH